MGCSDVIVNHAWEESNHNCIIWYIKDQNTMIKALVSKNRIVRNHESWIANYTYTTFVNVSQGSLQINIGK